MEGGQTISDKISLKSVLAYDRLGTEKKKREVIFPDLRFLYFHLCPTKTRPSFQ